MRIEICALDEDIDSIFGHAGFLTAEHAGDTHRSVSIGNDHVAVVKLSFDAVEGDDLLAFGRPSDNDFAAADLVSVKRVERLSDFEKHEVGDVHDIVYRVQSDGEQLLLKPFRRRAHFHALDGNSLIFRSSVRIEHLYRNRAFSIAFLECRNIRISETARDVVQFHIRIQVTCYADM